MDYNNDPLIDELAAQYVLGTLRGPARRRFERVCEQNSSAMLALRRWEDRLIELTEAIAPVRPSPAVWRKIEQRIREERQASRSRRSTNYLMLAMAASVLLAIGIASWLLPPRSTQVPSTQLVATIADEQQAPLWRVEATPEREKLHIVTTAAVPLDQDHAYELWALPESGAPPVSLGVVPQRGETVLTLTDAQRRALASAVNVAISREPPGGSPTGAPTGPVLFVAPVVIPG